MLPLAGVLPQQVFCHTRAPEELRPAELSFALVDARQWHVQLLPLDVGTCLCTVRKVTNLSASDLALVTQELDDPVPNTVEGDGDATGPLQSERQDLGWKALLNLRDGILTNKGPDSAPTLNEDIAHAQDGTAKDVP